MRDPAHNLIKVTSRTNRMQSELIIQKNCAESFLTQTREKTEEWEIWSLVSARSLFFLSLFFSGSWNLGHGEIYMYRIPACVLLQNISSPTSSLPRWNLAAENSFPPLRWRRPLDIVSSSIATRSAAWNKWSSRQGQAEIARRLSGVYSTENTTCALFVFASLWWCRWSAARRRVHAG